ncbi:Folliculin-interacting protein 1 [Amphibalanus amphitrite]|uniref:Folliculin-interacting protein 1 n=1 Tax=Amphibalanus amphitrite TaxID=1232801 RepID=A0A6A4WLU7_AMPAM|nr:Folliculin-interacting protein 1 [Amphibalanus amphitrite]KAF0308397.1 Folliculin-interacting protein 1 [Amphibalanus amphitrite]
MALLSRLFGGRKKSALKPLKGYDNVPEFNPWQPVALEPDQVTVLVYRECEVRGRRLLFDSSTVLLVPCGSGTTEHAGLIEVENDTGFKYTRQRPDAKQLGEMVFGTVAMAYGGPTCKVHIVRGAEGADPSCSPDTMMMSRVFPLRQPVRRARTHGSSGTSLDDSCSSTGSELSLLRLDVAGLPSPHHPRSSSMDCPPPAGRLSEDSGLSSVDSFMGPPSYMPTPYGTPLSAQGSGASLGSHGSLHRSARLRPIGSSDLMLTSRDDAPCLRMTSRAARLAVVVLVTLAGPARSVLEDTLLQYSLQLEHLLARLQHTVERAYHGRRHFVRTVHQATAVTKQDLLNLLTARRLPRPVWLGLTSDSVTSRQRQRLAELFVSELTSLIAELDTKEHNCFMSTLLTAVLTHHLHWVLTVAPRGGGAGKLQPPPPARTLVVGRRTELVSRLLLVLSYFIRDQLTALLESGRGGPGRQSLTPWSALGGGGSTYVPDLALWGCDTRAAWESRLRPDLAAAASSGEVSCVLADTDSYSVQVLSSHAFAVCDAGGGLSGLAVVFAPLVSALVESVCRVHETGAPAPLVLRHLESQLVQLTARAAEMAQFLINSSLANMQELTELMSVDSNDVPLLLSAASVLCPEVGSKYGISVR